MLGCVARELIIAKINRMRQFLAKCLTYRRRREPAQLVGTQYDLLGPAAVLRSGARWEATLGGAVATSTTALNSLKN